MKDCPLVTGLIHVISRKKAKSSREIRDIQANFSVHGTKRGGIWTTTDPAYYMHEHHLHYGPDKDHPCVGFLIDIYYKDVLDLRYLFDKSSIEIRFNDFLYHLKDFYEIPYQMNYQKEKPFSPMMTSYQVFNLTQEPTFHLLREKGYKLVIIPESVGDSYIILDDSIIAEMNPIEFNTLDKDYNWWAQLRR